MLSRGGGYEWVMRPTLAKLVKGAAYVIPPLGAFGASFAVAILMPHSQGLGQIAWWLGVVASAVLALMVFRHFARRGLVMASLLELNVTFSAKPVSRLRIALRASSVSKVQADMTRAYAPDSSAARVAECIALAAALEVLRAMQHRHSDVVLRAGRDELTARLIDSDIPGYFMLVPTARPNPAALRISIALLAVAALITSVLLDSASVEDRSHQAAAPVASDSIPSSTSPSNELPTTAGPVPVDEGPGVASPPLAGTTPPLAGITPSGTASPTQTQPSQPSQRLSTGSGPAQAESAVTSQPASGVTALPRSAALPVAAPSGGGSVQLRTMSMSPATTEAATSIPSAPGAGAPSLLALSTTALPSTPVPAAVETGSPSRTHPVDTTGERGSKVDVAGTASTSRADMMDRDEQVISEENARPACHERRLVEVARDSGHI